MVRSYERMTVRPHRHSAFTLCTAPDAARDLLFPYKIGSRLDDFTQLEVNERTLSLLRVRWGSLKTFANQAY